jgi:uncharacterized protein (TIGR03435 family)
MLTRLVAPLALACASFSQTPAFEVASVKQSEPITPALVQAGRVQIGVTIDAMNVRISKFSLYDLIRLAYQLNNGQELSGPSWMIQERYDIQAKLPEGAKRGQVPAMLQTLLAERFGLRIHRDNREANVYVLVPAKGGPRLKQSAADDTAPAGPEGQLRGGIAVGPGGTTASTAPGGNSQTTPGPGGNLHIVSKKMTLKAFADMINRYTDRQVRDMTGIEGAYDFEIDVSGEDVRNAARSHGMFVPPPAGAAAEAASDPSGVSLAASLEKLGLKLESRKAPVEMVVVDKVEKVPTEN